MQQLTRRKTYQQKASMLKYLFILVVKNATKSQNDTETRLEV